MTQRAQNEGNYNTPRYQGLDPQEEVIRHPSCDYSNQYASPQEMVLQWIVSVRVSKGCYGKRKADACC